MGRSMIVSSLQVVGRMTASVSKDLGDYANIADPTADPSISLTDTLSDGRGADQANAVYYDSKQISASANQDYDLVGTLTNAFGDTVNFDIVKTIVVKNIGTSGTNGTIRVVGQTFSSWCKDAQDYVVVPPGGMFMLHGPDVTGYDVSEGSDTLRITNTSGSLTAIYEIAVVGVEIDSSSSSSSNSSSSQSNSSSSSDLSSSSSSGV